MPSRSGIIRLVACLISGGLLSLAYPPVDLGWAVWVALIPMLIAFWTVGGKRAGLKGFGLGWAGGLVFFAINVSWLSTVTSIGPLALASYLALFFGAFGAFAATWGNPWRVAGRTWRMDLRSALICAAWWAILEWLRGWLLTGFGWNGVGVGLHKQLVLAQAADLLGVTGLSLFVLLIQMLLILTICNLRRKDLRASRVIGGATGAVVLFLTAYGFIRIAAVEKGEFVPLKALLVQLNIPQEAGEVAWEMERVHMGYEDETTKALEAAKAKQEWPDWVIWPESSLHGRLFTVADGKWGMWQANLDTIGTVREAGPFTLMLGLTELESEINGDRMEPKQKGRAWNSLVVMDPQNQLQSFHKHHLVIFGETIPFVETIPLLKKIYEQQSGTEYLGSFSSGESLDPLKSVVNGSEVGIIPSICFEDTVPRLTRKFVRPGPQIIVNVTNDGWFKESEAADQHFANAMFRSIELRRPMIRCANTGVSGAISATGRSQRLEDANGNHFMAGSLLAKVAIPVNPSFSLYALLGDWPVIGLGIAAFLTGFRHRRSGAQKP